MYEHHGHGATQQEKPEVVLSLAGTEVVVVEVVVVEVVVLVVAVAASA